MSLLSSVLSASATSVLAPPSQSLVAGPQGKSCASFEMLRESAKIESFRKGSKCPLKCFDLLLKKVVAVPLKTRDVITVHVKRDRKVGR